MSLIKNRRSIAGLAIAAILALSVAAYAYWTTNGSGTGSAANATGNGSLVLHASFGGGLTPGASKTVSYTADNAGTSSLRMHTIHSVVTTSDPACLPADFTIEDVTSDVTVPAGASGVAVGSGTLAFADTGANQDACKGATVTLTVTGS
jgi:hypothetical protein